MATDSSVDFRAVARPIAMMVNENEIMKRHMACQRQSPLLFMKSRSNRKGTICLIINPPFFGLLVKHFYDAISEGDGLHVLRCWKFMLLYLKEDGARSRKYSLEALYLQCQVNALLTHCAAHRLVWNRFLKTKYGTGGNIPLDLALEHFNKLVKVLIRNLGSKGLHKNAIDRHCKALATNKQLLDNFDEMCSIRKRSGNHAQKYCRNDLIKVVKGPIDNDTFIFTNGRTYKHFSGITSSLLTNLMYLQYSGGSMNTKKNVFLNKCAR